MKKMILHNHKFLLVIIFIAITFSLSAQIDYSYDAGGNRYLRSIVGSPRLMNPADTTKDPNAIKVAAQYGLNVYPNPSSNAINVTVGPLDSGKVATIYVIDITGKILYTKQIATVPLPIDISNYASGIYFVKAVINKSQLFYRVVKP